MSVAVVPAALLTSVDLSCGGHIMLLTPRRSLLLFFHVFRSSSSAVEVFLLVSRLFGVWQSFGTLPVPSWSLGQSVSLDGVNKVTDAHLQSLQPARKLTLPAGAQGEPTVVEGGKPVPEFKVRSHFEDCCNIYIWRVQKWTCVGRL